MHCSLDSSATAEISMSVVAECSYAISDYKPTIVLALSDVYYSLCPIILDSPEVSTDFTG